MSSWIRQLFGGGQPVRRIVHVRQTVDEDGEEVQEVVGGKVVSMGPQGGVDTVNLEQDSTYHCGCNKKKRMGGRCGEPGCRRLSCESCFCRCLACSRPLCLEHASFCEGANGSRECFCRHCFGKLRRRQHLRTVVKGVLSPFVEFDKENRK